MEIKNFIAVIITVIVFTIPTYSEFVFLKDGSIVEGKIVSDAAGSITIRDKDSRVKTIQRGSIMRVLYTSLKLGKIYIQKRDGEGIVAFMVDEDRDSYTFRKDLYKPEEFVIERSDVLFIAEKNPSGLKGVAETDRVSLTWLPPYDSVKHYNVYYSTSKSEKYKLAGSSWGKSYTLSNLASNKTYYIIVTSVDSDNYESSPSNELKIATKNIPPDAPEKIKKVITPDGKINISWEASKDKDGNVKEYRVFVKEKHLELKPAGTTSKTEYSIKGFNPKIIKQVTVKAVDNNGDESDETEFYSKPIIVTLKPLYAYSTGVLNDLFSSGYGAEIGLSAFDYLFDNSILAAEAGYIRWDGNADAMNYMDMFPVTLSIGYRFYFTDQISLSGIAGAGGVYMSTNYKNAVVETVTKSAFESIFTGSLSIDYRLSDNLSLSLGGGYYLIYEKSGMKSFAEAHISAGYRIF